MPVFALLSLILGGVFLAPDLTDKYVMKDKHLLSGSFGYAIKTGAYDKHRFSFATNIVPNITLPKHQFDNTFANFLYSNISSTKPIFGAGNINTGSWYAQVGISRDVYLTEKIALNFFTGPTLMYLSRADDLIMTGILQFKSSIEISYAFNENIRLGVSYFHMSNGGITPNSPNSGIDTMNLNLTFGL